MQSTSLQSEHPVKPLPIQIIFLNAAVRANKLGQEALAAAHLRHVRPTQSWNRMDAPERQKADALLSGLSMEQRVRLFSHQRTTPQV